MPGPTTAARLVRHASNHHREEPLSCFLAARGAHIAGLLEHPDTPSGDLPPWTWTPETTSNLSMKEEPRAGPTCRHGQLHPRCCSSASL